MSANTVNGVVNHLEVSEKYVKYIKYIPYFVGAVIIGLHFVNPVYSALVTLGMISLTLARLMDIYGNHLNNKKLE